MNGFDLILKSDEQDGGAEVYVSASLGGRAYQFLLDTGSAVTSLAWDDFTRRLPRLGSYSSSGVLGDLQEDLVRVADFKLGPIERSALVVRRLGEGHLHARSLIGMDLLKDYPCSFEFSRNWVSLEPQPEDGRLPLFLDNRFHPYVPVDCQGGAGQAVWDTGASLTCVDLAFIAHNPQAFEPAGESSGIDAAGHAVSSPMYRMQGFSCGGQAFPAHVVVGLDLSFVNSRIEHPMDMILGYSTLSCADWAFDFPNRKWGVVRMLDGSG